MLNINFNCSTQNLQEDIWETLLPNVIFTHLVSNGQVTEKLDPTTKSWAMEDDWKKNKDQNQENLQNVIILWRTPNFRLTFKYVISVLQIWDPKEAQQFKRYINETNLPGEKGNYIIWIFPMLSHPLILNRPIIVFILSNISLTMYESWTTWVHSGCECSGHRRSSEPWSTQRTAAAAGRQTAAPHPHCWRPAAHHTVGTRPLKGWRRPPPPRHLWDNTKGRQCGYFSATRGEMWIWSWMSQQTFQFDKNRCNFIMKLLLCIVITACTDPSLLSLLHPALITIWTHRATDSF